MNNKKFIFIIFIILTFWNFLIVSPRVANDYHFLFPELGKDLVTLPYSFREVVTAEGLGEYAVSTLWSWPLNFVYGIFSKIGIDFSITVVVLGIIPFVLLSFFGIIKIFNELKISGWAKYIGAFFFICNTYSILLLDGGQINLALSLSLLPLNFGFFLQAIKKNLFKDKTFFYISTIAISFLDFRIIYLVFLLITIRFIFEIVSYGQVVDTLKRYLSLGLITAFFLLGLHSYWLLPALLIKLPSLPVGYNRVEQVDFLSFSSIGHSLFLLQPHWPKNIFGLITQLKWEFGIIPIVVFLAPILSKKPKFEISFWMFIALVGIFLSKGSNAPFEGIYQILFEKIPGFSLFRDPTKFYFLVVFSFSVLLGFSIDAIENLTVKTIWIRKIVILFPLLFLGYIFFLIAPAYSLQLNGIFSFPEFKSEYFKLAESLKIDDEFSRVLWIPTKAPLGFQSALHPSLEAVRLASRRPFSVGVVGNYETLNFLREAPYIGEVLDVSAVGYIAYPFLDSKKQALNEDNIKYYYSFLDQISSLFWIDSSVKDSKVPLLKTKSHQDKLFLSPNLWVVIGADDIYQLSTKSAELKLAKNTMIFAEEEISLVNSLILNPNTKILLNNKNEIDLAAIFFKKENLIFPAKLLNLSPDKSGFWKRDRDDLIWWKDFLKTKYGIINQDFDLGGGWAVAENNLKLDINDDKILKGQILLARVLESTASGSIIFRQDNEQIGKLNTFKKGDNFKWQEIGELKSNDELTILTEGKINVLNSLAIVEKKDWSEYKSRSQNLIKSGQVQEYKVKNTRKETGSVRFDKINPTKYKIKIENIGSTPQYLVFSESFDSLWKLNGLNSLPAYSLLNVYKIDSDGEYILEYEPQKYVYAGLWISVVTLLILIIFLIRSYPRKTLI